MLKTLPPAARQVVLRDIRRRENPNEETSFESLRKEEKEALPLRPSSGHMSPSEESHHFPDEIDEADPGQLPTGISSKITIKDTESSIGQPHASESKKMVQSLRKEYSQAEGRPGYNKRISSLHVSVEGGDHGNDAITH